MKKLFMFLVMLFACFMFVACGEKEEEKTVIKIGGVGPTSGVAEIYGKAVKEGFYLAVKEINAAGGVQVGDQKLQFEVVEFVNDEHNEDKAKAAFNTLYDKGVDIIIGATTSGPTESLITEAVKKGTPVITPTGTADKLTIGADGKQREVRSNIFRACFYDSYQGEYMANYASEKGLKKAYVLYNNSEDYSIGLKDSFVKIATGKGMTVDTAAYEANDKDFSTQWATIIAGGYDCVYVPDYYEAVYNILKTGYAAGYQGVCYGGDGWDGIVDQIKAGEDASFLEKCFYTNHYFGGSQRQAVVDFVNKYKAEYDADPKSFAALAYDAVYVAKQAIEAAGKVDADAIVKALTEGTFSDLVTSGSSFKFKDGNPQKEAVVITFKDNKEVEVAE